MTVGGGGGGEVMVGRGDGGRGDGNGLIPVKETHLMNTFYSL